MMTIIRILDFWRVGVEFTVSQELLWLRYGDNSGTQRKEEHPPLESGTRGLVKRRFNACCSELQSINWGQHHSKL
jgi:hypothetical protein